VRELPRRRRRQGLPAAWRAPFTSAAVAGLLVPVALAAALAPARPAAGSPGGSPAPVFDSKLEWPLAAFQAGSLWAHARGAGVTVAVLDTGMNLRQPDLAGVVRWSADLVTHQKRGGGEDASADSHGTAVAGIIAARGSATSRAHMAGLAPGASLLDIRVSKQDAPVAPDIVAAGIRLAISHSARIIDVSLPVSTASRELARAVALARAKHCVIVAGAGSAAQPQALAAYPSVLIIGAVGQDRRPSGGPAGSARVSAYAPGTDLYSTGEPGKAGLAAGGYRHGLAGTGYAAAYFSAALALLLSVPSPQAAPVAAADLVRTERPLAGRTGPGEIDPAVALALVMPSPTPTPSPRHTSPGASGPGNKPGAGIPGYLAALLAVAVLGAITLVLLRRRQASGLRTSAPYHSAGHWEPW